MKYILIITCLLILVGCERKPTIIESKNAANKTVLNMKLSDRMRVGLWGIIKVHGGWIYERSSGSIIFIKDERENK